jgi:hypothetical protein
VTKEIESLRKQLVIALALFVFTFFCLRATSAQLSGGLAIPKVRNPKAILTFKQTLQLVPSAESESPAQGGLTILKSRIMFRPNTITSYKGEYNDIWSWVPTVTFNTDGTLPSGAHFYVEVAQPGGAAWMKIKCTDGTASGFECNATSDDEKNSTLATGVFPFVIKLRNPLEGTEKTLFTGKAKVEKVLSNEVGPKSVRKFVYYPNLDWNLPIGHVFIDDRDFLNVRFWIRGEATNTIDAHLFYRGQEVGLFEKYGNQYGASRCSSDIDYQPTRDAGPTAPQGAKWQRVNCPFETVATKPNSDAPEWHVLSANPGDYEVKVLRNKRLVRVIKFAIGSDGKIVDNRIAVNNGMGNNFIVVPVQISGEQDGPWDKMAWKTDAFYGNPLTGFNWPPQ